MAELKILFNVKDKTNLRPIRTLRMDIVAARPKYAQKQAQLIVKHARVLAPVRTGYLRKSIKSKRVTVGLWKVEVGAEYGKFVEYGTRFMRAQPFLTPGVRLARQEFREWLRTEPLKSKGR